MDSIILIGQKNTLAEYMILSGADNRPAMLDKDLVTRTKKYVELSATKKIQADCDLKATNIILQGLPSDIYSLVNHHRVAKDLWEKVQLLMQVNTKFLNSLPSEWSKFVTDVKLVKDFHTTNFDQLHVYLEQYELHANEARLMRERSQDPLALVANHQMIPSHFNTYQSSHNNPQFQPQQQFSPSQYPQYGSNHFTQHYSTTYPSILHAITYPSALYPNAYTSTVHQEACPQPQSVPKIKYIVSTVNQQTHLAEFPQIDSGLTVPVFKQGDDPIDAINKMMSFLSTVVTSRTRANTSRTGGNYLGQQRFVKCFNCQGEGQMERQCPKPKRKRDATWFREKVLLAEAQGNAYQADDLNAYDSDCDEISTAKAVLMANLSSYIPDVLSENEIHSDSNIIPYSQYLIESQNAAVQDTSSSAQQDALILSVFELLSNQVTNYNKVNNDNLFANKSLFAELERYKEWVKLLEERQNVDLELTDEQALHCITDQSASSLVKIEAPRELSKMEAVVQQYHVDKQCFEIQRKQYLIKNDQLLDQIISQDIVNIVMNSSMDVNTSLKVNSSVVINDYVNYVKMCNKCLELEAELIKQHNMVEKDEYNRLLKRFFELEQHCISLEIAMQLNKEIFQKTNTSVNQTEPSFHQLFELNNLKAELQAKDTTIKKLKAHIKSINETSTSERKSICHNSIRNDLRKVKRKDIVANVAHISNDATIAPGMYKLDPVILAPKVKNNREAHEYYLKHAMEQAAILRELLQKLLGYVRDTCPDIHKPSEKLVAVTPINKKKTVRFADTPSGNTKNDRISQTPSTNEKNKVEVQSTKVKSKLNKQNSDSKNVCNEHVKHPVKGAKALCSICNECLFDANHAMCLIDHVNSMNKPIGRTFTLVGNVCPLTRRPKVPKFVQNSKPKVAKSMTANRMEPGTSRGSDTSVAPTIKFGDDQVAKIMGYGDYPIGNVTISRVYYVEGLRHNLFSVGQFCDSDLEVAFRKHTCFVRNLEGVDLLSGSRETNLYSLSIWDMIAHGLVRGLPWLKFEKDHLCSACAMGKSKKQSHKPKYEDTNQEKLYLLHMDLCGPMRVASVNRKKYIFVIVNDYSRFTWVKFLASKDEAPDFIIKFLKMIQLTAMASEQLGSGAGLQCMTPATPSLGLIPNPPPLALLVPPSRHE
ncbi:retrovirus-related pol polyprotein from transposon TNT 1-94 [Tanacetum coccineum]